MFFTKIHGCGNDYIFLDCRQDQPEQPGFLARKLCHRKTGIGGDGLVLLLPSDCADCRMVIYNPDGSEAEMCGNAIRGICYLYNKLTGEEKDILNVETLSGVRECLIHRDFTPLQVTVDMGEPVINPRKIPVLSERGVVINEEIQILGETFTMTCVSMGNPHAVVFVEDVSHIKLEEIGIPFEHNLRFPNRTNVEFVQVISRERVRVRVWERGTGETLACGTGACAVVAAGVLTGRLSRSVEVMLPGGNLHVDYDEVTNHIWMSGPTVMVFDGEIDLDHMPPEFRVLPENFGS
ncbi:diaminopimelate epimerase [Anaerolentibacter hominis]|uniref:diaminopimelate epimerase n=1 Tax=Anaerolentibacter hominis TaxID=3079009 RepID=UPI0031B82BEC